MLLRAAEVYKSLKIFVQVKWKLASYIISTGLNSMPILTNTH